MITEESILKTAESFLESHQFLVSVKVHAGNKIEIDLDGDEGVSIQECVSLSRHIESVFDREEEDYALVVSSPGLDKPLRHLRQYSKNVGRNLKVTLEDDETIEGKLTQADENGITLVFKPKGKKMPEEEKIIAYSDIVKAFISISFK